MVSDSLLSVRLPDCPPAAQLLANISGVMINTDYILDYARPQPPTFLNVGGIQIREKPGDLPDSLLNFIETAEDGVILFTMGFIFKSKVCHPQTVSTTTESVLQAVPRSTVSRLMEVFSRLPQRVIMKLDSDYWREAAPSNVMVVPWVPQQAVLAHNNTRLFITHCGMHGVLESIHYAVPLVGMPVFIDQARRQCQTWS